LARPTITLQGTGTDRLVLVIDVSASMKATDVIPNRFAEAQRAAIRLVDEAGRGAEIMVIEAGLHPVIPVPFTRDADLAPAGIYALQARDLPNSLTDAIRMALTFLSPLDTHVRVQVVTDGAFDPALVREFPDPRVRWVTVGGGGHNVGITQFALRKSYFGVYD